MECIKVRKKLKILAIKGNGAFEDFGKEVPKAAQQFLVRVHEVSNSSGTEIAIFEPKIDENHLEGTYYVGMIVNQAPIEIPNGMDYIELNEDYVMTRGNIDNIRDLHNHLLKWIDTVGYKRNVNAYIVETYHPLEFGKEEVEIYLPISI